MELVALLKIVSEYLSPAIAILLSMLTACFVVYSAIKKWGFVEQGHLIQELNRLTTEVRFRSEENDHLRDDLRELKEINADLSRRLSKLEKEMRNV